MLIEAIYRQARNTPLKVALLHGALRFTYADFARRIEASRLHFAAQGITPRSTVVLAIEHLALVWIHGIALRSLGYTTICLPVSGELASLRLPSISTVVAAPGERTLVTADEIAARGWLRLQAPPQRPPDGSNPQAPSLPQAIDAGGHILMTSGTTGDYKMILRSAAADASTIALHLEINQVGADSVLYVGEFAKLTGGGYRWPLMSWCAGATVVFHQGAAPHETINRESLTHLFATPSTLLHLLQAPEDSLHRQDAARLMVTGGAMSKRLLEAAQARFTRRIFAMFASTEALSLAVTPVATADDLQWHRVHPLREVQVVDDSGAPLPRGRMGLIRARILDGVDGYLDDPEASRRFFAEGWFYPGDLGLFGADGRLCLQGRATDVLNVLGSKIATSPIEQALQDTLGVTAVCVLSAQRDGEDEVHVVIECEAMPSKDVLEPLLTNLFAPGFRNIHFHGARQLPRNPMGKVLRAVLQQQILAQRR